ncbi:MAG: hypothetical protein HUN04_07895 [Desulfobacter sp.]|nr:MAG: hypothetical protein HUN04_07895 [Desulfobacter sp.]
MKKQIAIVAAAFLIIGLSTASAQAGAARRHTIEGILIGTGITLLGTAIANSISHPAPERTIVHHRYDARYAPHHKKHRRGHWEICRIWVKPVYTTSWHPGHYNKRGRWTPGRHQRRLAKKGHWERKRVWVRQH